MDVRVQNVSKSFERYPALTDVSLHVRAGELVALLGPSGSGKTTLLRLIAWLERPNEGRIFFGEVLDWPTRSHRPVKLSKSS